MLIRYLDPWGIGVVTTIPIDSYTVSGSSLSCFSTGPKNPKP